VGIAAAARVAGRNNLLIFAAILVLRVLFTIFRNR
jgi:hypothetical protein